LRLRLRLGQVSVFAQATTVPIYGIVWRQSLLLCPHP